MNTFCIIHSFSVTSFITIRLFDSDRVQSLFLKQNSSVSSQFRSRIITNHVAMVSVSIGSTIYEFNFNLIYIFDCINRFSRIWDVCRFVSLWVHSTSAPRNIVWPGGTKHEH